MSRPLAVAIDLGGTYIKGGVVSPQGDLLHKEQIPTGDRGVEPVCVTLAGFIGALSRVVFEHHGTVAGVGIGSPGGIYNDRATVSQSPNFPDWTDVNLKEKLASRGIGNIVLENDANIAALGENWVGSGRDVQDMAAITLGTGVGGGIILARKIWRGTWGMAGELGHITIVPDGPACGCGNTGCLEALVNIDAINGYAQAAVDEGKAPVLRQIMQDESIRITPKAVFDAAKAGDADCLKISEKVATYIGIAITDLLNVLNLPLFVIGGGVSAAFDLLGPLIVREVRRRAYRVPGENVRIIRAELGNDAGLLGAARLVFQEAEA